MKQALWITLAICIYSSTVVKSQTAYEHVSNHDLYNFIDYLATIHLIEVNTTIKPYSREQIAYWLTEADGQRERLSKSQQKTLDIYLSEYAMERGLLKRGGGALVKDHEHLSLHILPPELTWRDSLFRTIIRPIYGARYFASTNASFYHTYGGAEAIAYIDERWSVYASLRDNYQNKELLARPSYLTQEPGGNYKFNVMGREGGDYSEMRGGITYTWNWGSLGLIKDHIAWGDNNNGSNIFSGRAPSFPVIKLNLNPVSWLDFNYFHGWLTSMVIDSVNSYYVPGGQFRATYYPKYIAANMYTFTPLRRLNFSIGNAIVYDNQNVHAGYLIPFFFFKSLTHTFNARILNNNSMMFMNISSRQIRHVHLYASLYVDEFSITRVGDPDRHNFWSFKGGFSLEGWPLKDFRLIAETTRTSPMTYQHRVPTTTFETNNFNLGHYLRSNSMDYFVGITYTPVSTLEIAAGYGYALKANVYPYIYGTPDRLDEYPILQDKTWTDETIKLRARMMPLPNLRIFAEYRHSHHKAYDVDGTDAESYLEMFSPAFLHGKTNTLIFGLALGI